MDNNYYTNFLQSSVNQSGKYPESETQKQHAQSAWELTRGQHGHTKDDIYSYWKK